MERTNNVNRIMNELFDLDTDTYINGECYSWARVFHIMYPNSRIYINYEKYHCISRVGCNYYDANGIVRNLHGYKPCNDVDFRYMDDNFGDLELWYDNIENDVKDLIKNLDVI